MVVFSLLCLVVSISQLKIINIVSGIICLTLSYVLSKISINGLLVKQFGDITSSDTITTNTVSITNLPMSYIFLFIAIIALIITINNILVEVKYNLEPDLEGDLDL
jgi:hypothetical protein